MRLHLRAFENGLAALSNAHDILTGRHWEGASIAPIVEGAVAPYRSGSGCFLLDGPDLPVGPKMAVSLALALHACDEGGQIWSIVGAQRVCGNTVAGAIGAIGADVAGAGRPARRTAGPEGFGTRMIERAHSAELGGEVRLDFDPAGVVCTVEAPLAPR